MDPNNISQLVVPYTPPLEQRTHIEASERDAEFLSLKLLNKRGRVRLSPAGFEHRRLPGKSTLLAVANKKGWLAAAVRKEDGTNHILLSSLADLRAAFESGEPDPKPFIPFTPKHPLFSVPGTPIILKFALNDQRLLIGFLEGPILVYNTNDLCAPAGSNQPNPIHAFPGDASTIPRDISPNPGESPELVAIMRGVHGQGPGHQVDVVDVLQLKHIAGWRKGNDPNIAAVSISWSPRGKQIAIGLQSGDMILYSPLSPGTPKSHLLKPPSVPAEGSSLLATTWLSNPTFHTVYSTPEACSSMYEPPDSNLVYPSHFISSHDSKAKSAVDVELRDPAPPFGAVRPPGLLSVVLRNWSPTKFIIFCGDGTSADIGVIGTLPGQSNPTEDAWVNFILEETSTPSLPLDEDAIETVLFGLEIDLTSSKPVRMSEQPDDGTPDLPPSPILYAYVSDGSVVAWHVLNSNGDAYPGMVTSGEAGASLAAAAPLQPKESVQAFGMSSPRVSPPASPSKSPLFPPAQASGSPTNPASAFGQTASPPAPSPSAFGGFGSGGTSSKFGATGFGFGSGSGTNPATSPFGQPSTTPAFGSSAFGSGGATKLEAPKSTSPSAFGASAAASPFGQPSATPAFGSSAFGGNGGSQFEAQKLAPSPAFGATGFGKAPAVPAFGASAFGSKPAAPAFGQSAFGAPSSGATSPVSAFGSKTAAPAFSQSGFGTAPSPPVAAKPVNPFGSSSGGGFASFASQGTSAFGAPVNLSSTSEAKPAPAFGAGSFGRTTSPSTPQSAFPAGGLGQASPSPPSAFGSGGVGQASTSSPTSAFGQQQASQPTPSFGGFGQKAATPAFGATSFGNMASPTKPQNSAFGGFGTLGDALKPSTSLTPAKFDSPPGSPTSPAGSPPDSPELRPASQPMKPTSSYLKPAEGFGSFVKPAGGFGASGASPKPASSFIKPAEGFGSSSQPKSAPPGSTQQKPAAPAFGTTGFASPMPSSSKSAAPTFGSTSALGMGRSKPVFGTSTFGSAPQPAVIEPSKPITGGFGAFSSGNGGGFASFANAGKSASFADILGSTGQEKPKSSEAPLAFGGTSEPKPSPAPSPAPTPAFGAPGEPNVSPTPAGKPADVSSIRDTGVEKVESDEEDEKDKERFAEDDMASQKLSNSPNKDEDPSFSLLSLSEATSQVSTPSAPQTPAGSPEKVKEVAKEPEVSDENENEEGQEDTASEPFSLTDDGIDESGSEDGEREPYSPTDSPSEDEADEPAAIPLPDTPRDQTPRSTPTPTPVPSTDEAKTPEVEVSSPPLEPSSPESSVVEHDASTTPPGSPEKPVATTQSPLPAPLPAKPVLPTSTSSPFGLGLGRPSSRPIRSSPLASAPITSADNDDSAPDVTLSKPAPALAKAKSEPKAPFGQWSPPVLVPATAPPADSGSGTSTAKPRRPKTPPLLGISPSTQGLKPAPLGSSFAVGQSQIPPTPFQLPSPPVPSPVVAPVISAPSQLTPEEEAEEISTHPMQVEFLRAYQDITKELVQLYKKAQEMALIRPIISEPRGLDKLVLNNQDFVPGKYSHGDLQAFATMIGTLQKRVIPILQQGNANKRLLQDLQNLSLISETKLEEVSRWVRAREDPDFAKTLKPRTLGPEHSENQIRLRKAVQTARDRIQQCEDEMESLKKRLEQQKSGKVGFRPPTLDTIDRTCRNIQLALEERTKLLEQLRDRIETLSPRDSQRLQSPRGQLGSRAASPATMTPPFASIAAAALNSERSSLRLKSALLSARKQPLLTTKITKLEGPRSATPSAQVLTEVQRPEWKLPPVPPLGMASSSVARRAGRTGKRHGAVQFTPSPNAKPAAFDWGPLPGAPPMEKLSLDVRSQKGKGHAGFAKQDAGDDAEWDQEAEEDYKRHH